MLWFCSVTPRNEIPTATPHFRGPEYQGHSGWGGGNFSPTQFEDRDM